jgi:hypothetical protein
VERTLAFSSSVTLGTIRVSVRDVLQMDKIASAMMIFPF